MGFLISPNTTPKLNKKSSFCQSWPNYSHGEKKKKKKINFMYKIITLNNFSPRLLLPWKHGEIQGPPISFVLPAFSTSLVSSSGTWTPSSAQNCNSSDQLCQLSWGHSFRSGQMFLDFPFMCLPQLHAWWHFAAGAASYLNVLHILNHRKVYLEFNLLKVFQ